jgi:hypothetical protein
LACPRPSTLVAASDMPSEDTNAASADTLNASTDYVGKRTPLACPRPSTLVAASDMPSEDTNAASTNKHPRCQYRLRRKEDAVGPCMPVDEIDNARHWRPCSAHTGDVPIGDNPHRRHDLCSLTAGLPLALLYELLTQSTPTWFR